MSSDPEGYTYQSSDPVGFTYQSSDLVEYTYQSSNLEGYTYQSSDPEGCTYQSSDPVGFTYQSSDPVGYTCQSSDSVGYTYQSSDSEGYTYQFSDTEGCTCRLGSGHGVNRLKPTNTNGWLSRAAATGSVVCGLWYGRRRSGELGSGGGDATERRRGLEEVVGDGKKETKGGWRLVGEKRKTKRREGGEGAMWRAGEKRKKI
ncbi:NBS-LRR type resistance protein [Cucumis melo var. makuwa]|uniref:NBS-LRR type resistance protein n=1 Tax=Cucumis melo var. makuwa TaxID=1194695 RepID=A0A5A7TW74_CUCMM|nr:NBS-LRR type resistance protein [Cucumis melo var. makuwa]TYK01318.1 NBS-LRR type resistance protein [Cucumis melo var. makuwa]